LLPACRRRRARVVERIKGDGVVAETDADADDRAEKAHFLDRPRHAVAAGAVTVEKDGLGAEGHRMDLARPRFATAAAGGDLLSVDRDQPFFRIDDGAFEDVESA